MVRATAEDARRETTIDTEKNIVSILELESILHRVAESFLSLIKTLKVGSNGKLNGGKKGEGGDGLSVRVKDRMGYLKTE